MTNTRFFFTPDDCIAWFQNLDWPSLQIFPMESFEVPQTKSVILHLSQFFQSLASKRIDTLYIVSNQEIVPNVVPKKRGNGNYYTYDRRANLHAWQIGFGGIKERCFYSGELFGEVMDEFGSTLVTEFYKIASFRSKDGDFFASKNAISLHKDGTRFLCGMNALSDPAWDIKF
jgi:hypothetical protein